jgi:hypothetical protein
MPTYGGMMMPVEPDTKNCTTEVITSELSSCSERSNKCKYAFYAGEISTYCMHPDHNKFRILSALK